ncbi:MAG TPA: adenylyl-sulfate kinase, partial [Roseimicrobium sp.]|nr:adenylyl-sulfate kinase [Roseimicrobium sp.]
MTQLTDKIASDSKISHESRTQRNGHRGCIVWLTGLSGSGKSTLARALERRLFDEGRHVYVLDGDLVRTGLCSDLTFSMKDRTENIRRVGEVARLMADSGLIVIVAFISPLRADRDRIRVACQPGEFIEVFVNAPLDVCEKRDVKGLYVKARNNVLKEFTGISSPYEAPLNPEVELHTDTMGVSDCVERMV